MEVSKKDLISRILKKKESKSQTDIGSSQAYPRLQSTTCKCGPLSPAQKRIYLLSQMNGQKDIAYNLPEVLRIDGELSGEKVDACIREVIRRHDILRTSFAMEDGEIVQQVHEAVEFELVQERIAFAQFDAWLKNFIRPFDLTRPCLLRCALVSTDQGSFVVFDSHHIIGDGFSAGIINSELAKLYQGHKLPPPKFQYLDYVEWNRRMQASPTFKRHEQYWLDALSGHIPILDLPLDYGRPDRKDFLGSTLEFGLGSLAAPLKALFRAEQVTLYTGLIAVYSLFLAKLTNQEDIYIATPVIGRPTPELRELPGMFVNTLPVVTRPRADLGFIEFIHAVKTSVFACLEHADCDISHLVDKLGIKRNAARNPLFDTLFVLQVRNLDTFEDNALNFTPHAFDRLRSQFDLSLEAVERGEDIVFKLDYATALFHRDSIARFRDQLLQLIENVIAAPTSRISELSLLSAQQQHALCQWQTPLTQETMRPISDVFEEAAARMGDKSALIHEGRHLSYRELAKKVQSLAAFLRASGVGRDDFVCLLLDRSFDMIVAILAVIKAGGAYVPIEPDCPEDRIKFIVEDCKPKFLITQADVACDKADFLEALSVDVIADISQHCVGERRLETINEPSDLMYLIYTSGTTGLPKGVMVEHRCLYALLKGNHQLDFSADDRWALFHSYAFDVSVWEIFASLLHGCTLLLIPKKTTRDTPAVRRLIRDEGITILNQTPTAFYRFIDVDAECEDRLALRWVNFAGEALLPGRLAKWREKYPDTALINMYGITETTVHTTYKKLTNADIENGECSNIGVSLDSLYIYLLDRHQKLCPPGVIGEIYVGGWGVTRGYLNRPQLNAERFIDDPFSLGRRLYRSGDLARWTNGGELEYLGRTDHQVKIRGHRIECGEIENWILKQTNVKAASVLDKADARGEKYLCAVVQSSDFGEEDAARLKQELGAFLPAYMIPTHIVAIDEIPMTVNGKLDRRKIADHLDSFTPAASYVAPVSATEASLATIWQGFFPKAGPIGREHDFFEMGGHSLLAIEMALEIKKACGKQVTLEALFTDTRLSQLAAHIDAISQDAGQEPIVPTPHQEHYDASTVQQRLFFIDQMTPPPGIAYNVPLAFSFEGNADLAAWRENLTRLVACHEALRTRFCLIDGSLKQIISDPAEFSLTVGTAKRQAYLECVHDFIRPFDLQRDTLFRAHLVQFEDSSGGLILFDFHHIVCDGMSLAIVLEDLARLFLGQALSPELLQYRDYCHWWANHHKLGDDTAYWLRQLDRAPRLDLYTDFARPTRQSFSGGEVTFTLDHALSARFDSLCREHRVTAHMAFMTVFSLLLSKLSGQEDLIIGSPYSGRTHDAWNGTVGMFVGTMPIRCRPQPAMSFADYLQAVRQVCLEAHEHPHFLFEEIAGKVAERDVARNPIFDCMLDLQLADSETLNIANLQLHRIPLENPTAKMDLMLSIRELERDPRDDCSVAGKRFACTLNFATALYSRETAQALANGFQGLLVRCLATPSAKLAEFDVDRAAAAVAAYATEMLAAPRGLSPFYWKRRFADRPVPLDLPTDRPRSIAFEQLVLEHVAPQDRLVLDAPLLADLYTMCKRHNVTLACAIMTAWTVVLMRLSRAHDIVLGQLIDSNAQQANGALTNLLPIRLTVCPDDDVARALALVRDHSQEAYQHRNLSYERLAEIVQGTQGSARRPLFQAMFAWRDSSHKAAESQNDSRLSCELCLDVQEHADQLVCEIAYASSLYDASSAVRILSYLRTVLAAMATDQAMTVSHLPLLSEPQRRQILIDWNATQTIFDQDVCIHELFERQVERTPDAVAVRDEASSLSFSTLNECANRLAHRLIAAGVGPDRRVAICVTRSIDMMVAVIATLKAGGAYVPLDPDYPAERLLHILTDSNPAAVLAHGRTHAVISSIVQDTPLIDLDAHAQEAQRWSGINPDRIENGARPSNLAYVIYTSGSTGKPKGVAVEHRSANNLAEGLVQQVYGGAKKLAGLKLGLNASLAFDASVQQWLMLNYGATLHLLSAQVRLDMDRLAHTINAWKLDGLDFTPAQLSTLLLTQPGLHLPRYLLVGGEAIDQQLWKRLQKHTESAIFNMYGPTEATVDTILCNIHDAGPRPVLGRPIINTQVYILDEWLQVVPIGVTGELYIAGDCLARGYLNRPDLCEERFVANPFSSEPDKRMYRTGDLGRFRADGSIEYLGRNDFQVKIRGFRIELGEIESRLHALPDVREAAVVARATASGDLRLIAYVVSATGSGFDPKTLRAALARDLADYMLPSGFVRMDALPLSPNGKLDRNALPDLPADSTNTRTYEAPQGALEMALSQLWRDVLKCDAVDRHDHFFALGGHSLLAVQLVSRIRQTMHVDIVLNDLFNHPTLAEFSKVVAAAEGSGWQAITKVDRSEPLPLSHAQQRLWFLSQMEGADRAYHLFGGVTLHGEIDRVALSATFGRIVARHEILRTTFRQHNGRAVQVIAPAASTSIGCPLRYRDLRGDSSAQAQLQHELERMANAPFDFEKGPLLRASLVQMAQYEYVLCIAMHHIVSDGWSLDVLMREISAIYADYVQADNDYTVDPLPELPIQYADYTHWQLQALSDNHLERQASYWKQQLAGIPVQIELPTDRPRPQQQSHAGATYRIALDANLSARIKAFGQGHGCTLYMTLLASWAALLARLSGQDDVVIGSPVSGRQRSETEDLIGFFVNTLALRFKLNLEQSVGSLLDQTRQVVLDAQNNQDLPFEQIVDIVQPLRSLAHTPIFQVMFAWQHASADTFALPGIRVTQLVTDTSRAAKFDLSMNLQEIDGRIVGELEYTTALYDVETIVRHVEHWTQLLSAMVESDQACSADLPLLSQEQRMQVLHEWNATHASFPQDLCIHQLFEQQVALTPNAIAVSDDAQSLSFCELNERANRLAHHLRDKGVGPDERVAICVVRSVDMVVSLLATLKAGGAYVPLDPDYPIERLTYMLDDSDPIVTIVHANTRELLRASCEGRITIDLDTDYAVWVAKSAQNPNQGSIGLQSNHLAYVIYTSGSTGKPKGAMNEHRGVVNRLVWMQKEYAISPDDRILQKTPFSFDVSVWEFFLPLISGARLILARPFGHKDPAYLSALIHEQEITILHFVPSMLQVFLDHADLAQCCSVVRIICSGEALPASLVQRFHGLLPDAELHNLYGPTEVAVDVTAWHCKPGTQHHIIPIGRPIANTRVYILDQRMQPVPIGVTGELYLGGVQVGRGYWNREELSAERFVTDPFCDAANARMYKTGDLARFLPDGNIQYLGRNDFQVKLRGLRIELGEIEAHLCTIDGIREAVVLAREDQPGDVRLIAYLTASNDLPLDAAILREALARELPDYMLPSAYIRLDALPLNSNGKLDRKVLPAPDAHAYLKQAYEAPSGETERLLHTIWSNVLRRESIGRHDNFFELGGHSLLALDMIQQMRQAGLYVDIRALFGAPTIAQLAAAVARTSLEVPVPANRIPESCTRITPDMLPLVDLMQDEIDRITTMVPGGVSNIQDIYPLAPLQEGILFHHLSSAVGDTYLLPVLLAFDTRQRVDAFIAALDEVIARHDILRTAILWEEQREPVQVVWRRASLMVEEVQLDPQVDTLIQLREQFNPLKLRMDVRQAPLMRGIIVEDQINGRWLMQALLHHLVVDHTTMEQLISEVRSVLQDQPLPPALPFRNFVAQARLGISEQEHTRFFTRMLSDVTEPTAPYGIVPTSNDTTEILEATCELNRELSTRLRVCANSLGVSAATIMHLAWAHVLGRLALQERVVFGTVLLGRMQSGEGSHRALGLFINTLPIRVELGDRSVLACTHAIHALLNGLLRHEHASLALAQRCSGVSAPTPLFTSLLNYRHTKINGHNDAMPGHFWDGVEVLASEERSNYPFSLSIDDLGEDFRLTAQAIGAIEAHSLCTYMETVLHNLAAAIESAPHTAMHDIDILPAKERHLQLVEWNATDTDFPKGECLQSLIERQVAATPDNVALVYEDAHLTYTELNVRANRLAHHLLALGVRPDMRVAICIDRSLDMVVAVLATLKAGAAYVPLDPHYPKNRLRHILQDSEPAVILVHALTRDTLGAMSPASVIVDLDQDAAILAVRSPDNPQPEQTGVTAEHLAYVIYTSGSTGVPKGVMVNHQGLCNLAAAEIRMFAVTPESHVLQFASFSFDAFAFEMMMALCSGASLYLISRKVLLSGVAFSEFVVRHRITHATLPPAFLATLPSDMALDSLKTMIVAGEASTESLVQRWAPGRRFINAYGPTEATVCATAHDCLVNASGIPPIGRPLANTRIYILDSRLKPVPVGVVGELYIGGVGVARGYLNRPDLTAERFLQDPFHSESNAKMYKTGDLARYLDNGNIEYIGRNDFQVKVRGFRIELGEIESRLSALTGIRQAIVFAKDSSSADKRLIACIVADDDNMLDTQHVRKQLAEHLADYMLPTRIIQLKSLPVTPNGKVDRKALEELEHDELDANMPDARRNRNIRLPLSANEVRLHAQWQQLLRIDNDRAADLGCDDDFFELGGTSLSVIRMISFIAREFGITMRVDDLFKYRTIAELARQLDTHRGSTPSTPIVRFGDDTRPSVFCIPGIHGHALGFKSLAAAMPDFTLQCLEPIDLRAQQLVPLDSIDALCHSYLQAIREAQPHGPYRLVGHSIGGLLALNLASLLEREGEIVEGVGLLDTYAEMDIDEDNINSQTSSISPFDAAYVHQIFSKFEHYLDCNLGVAPEILSEMSEAERIFHITTQLAAHQIIPTQDTGFVRAYLNLRKLHEDCVKAFFKEKTRARFSGRVCLFKAEAIEPVAMQAVHEDYGWNAHHDGEFHMLSVPGSHESMITPPYASALADALTQWFVRGLDMQHKHKMKAGMEL